MAEIRNEKEFRAWLKDRPREVSVVLAARSALRILPLWRAILPEIDAETRAEVLLPVFRASAVSLVAAVGPTNETEVRNAARAAADAAAPVYHAAGALLRAQSAPVSAHIQIGAPHASSVRAGDAAASGTTQEAAEMATFAALAAADACDSHRGKMWAALSADCDFLDGAGETDPPARAEALAAQPLWPSARWGEARWGEGKWGGGTPGWAEENWQGLRRSLNAVNGEHWVVWTRWYQDRLDGKRLDKPLEEARVLIPAHLWDEGPAAVNAELLRIEREHGVRNMDAQTDAASSAEMPAAQPDPPPEPDPAPPELDIDALLESRELRATLADFSFDDLGQLMRMVPFVEETSDLDEPARTDRANKLTELADAAGDLARDIQYDNRQVPGALRRDLNRYGRESQSLSARLGPAGCGTSGFAFAPRPSMRISAGGWATTSRKGWIDSWQTIAS